jgi:tape measure domain-containing protein
MANIRASLQLDTKKAEKSVDRLGGALKALASAAAVKATLDLANVFQNLNNRLLAVTKSNADYLQAQKDVEAIAKSTRSSLAATGDLYASLTIASEDLGLKQQDVADITEVFSKTLKISGAETGAAAGAMVQFGQALASGVLRGDEFNSINETNSKFMGEFADILGVTRGELRKMAEQGLLTADVLSEAALIMGEAVDEDFGKTLPTIFEQFENIRTEFILLLQKFEEATGVFAFLGRMIKLVGDNMLTVLGIAGTLFSIKIIQGIYTFTKGIISAAVAVRTLATAEAAALAFAGPAGWAALATGVAAFGATLFAVNVIANRNTEEITNQKDELEGLLDTYKEFGQLDPEAFVGPPLPEGMQKKRDEERIKKLREEIALNAKKEAQKREEERKAKELSRIIARDLEKAKEIVIQNTNDLNLTKEQLILEGQLFGLTEDEKELKTAVFNIEKQRADALADIQSLQLDKDPARNLQLQLEKIAEINGLYDEQIQKIKEIITANQVAADDLLNRIKEGLEQAGIGDFVTTLADGLVQAVAMFEDSLADAIVQGKADFSDLGDFLKQVLAKAMVQKFITGPIMGLFGLAKGGPAKAGQPYIIGEEGPEIFVPKQSGVVLPNSALQGMNAGGPGIMAGGTTVNYNIQAVDAPSFQQLVARDPEFIFNVSRAGSRRTPA